MGDLSEVMQDHLPEELRAAPLTLDEIVDRWVARKSYLAIRSLEKDILSYAKKFAAGDYSVDELLELEDLLFIPERFGCDGPELLLLALLIIKKRMAVQRRSVLDDIRRWLRR